MFDEESGASGVFLFDEFADHLQEQGVDASPSRVHGCLSGLLAAGAPRQAEYGLDALGQALDLALYGELAGRVLELYGATAVALDDEDFEFYPLLPDDEADLHARTSAMAGWCNGFLAGFALVSAAGDRSGGALSHDSGEILKDIAAISKAEVDDDADEEDSEESYAELVEYLRFAVLNVVMDCRPD
jgi:yecA family protein